MRTRSWATSRITTSAGASSNVDAVHPIDELRAAVEAAAGDLRNGKPAPTRA